MGARLNGQQVYDMMSANSSNRNMKWFLLMHRLRQRWKVKPAKDRRECDVWWEDKLGSNSLELNPAFCREKNEVYPVTDSFRKRFHASVQDLSVLRHSFNAFAIEWEWWWVMTSKIKERSLRKINATRAPDTK